MDARQAAASVLQATQHNKVQQCMAEYVWPTSFIYACRRHFYTYIQARASFLPVLVSRMHLRVLRLTVRPAGIG